MVSFLDSLLSIPNVEIDDNNNLKEPPFFISRTTEIFSTNENYDICKMAKDRNIKYLYHFTDIRNLSSILIKGLMIRNQCGVINCDFFVNDYDRLDGTGGICCSISFPNYKMFYTIRKNRYPDRKYCIVVLDALQVFQKYNCYFFDTNASSKKDNFSEIFHLNNYKECKSYCLNRLFSNESLRIYKNLKTEEPTDVQAEVIVMDNISTDCFLGVCLENYSILNQLKAQYCNYNNKLFYVDSGLFLPRHDHNIMSNYNRDCYDKTYDEIENLYNEQERMKKNGCEAYLYF